MRMITSGGREGALGPEFSVQPLSWRSGRVIWIVPALLRALGAGPLLAVLVFLAWPVPGRGQAGFGPDGRVSATASVLVKAGEIAGKHRTHFGGWAGVVLSPGLAVGGGGFALLNDVEIAGTEGGTGFILDFGYGGIFFRYWEPLVGNLEGEVGLLLGAGHAEVDDRLSRREVGSANFMVGEVEMGLAYPVFRQLHLAASVGYRLTSGVEDLPRVRAEDLNAFIGTLSLRLGGN